MAQRGVLGKISRWFSGPSDTYFFGLQVAMKCFGEDTLRARFARVEESRLADEMCRKSGASSGVLWPCSKSRRFSGPMGFGTISMTQEAAQEFNTWVNEIESGMATEEEELGEAVDDLRRTSNHKDYVVVTLLFLLDAPYAPAQQIATDDETFLKETFMALVQGLTSLDPRTIQADGTYVVPGRPTMVCPKTTSTALAGNTCVCCYSPRRLLYPTRTLPPQQQRL